MREIPADPTKAFLGVGWAFPPGLAADGSIVEAVYEEDVRQAIQIILSTDPGERVMRPDFGAGLSAFVFEPLTSTTIARVTTRVQEALVAWEPRIDMQSITVAPQGAQANLLLIEMAYRVRATNTLHNLVYPFYLQERTPL